MIDLILLYLLAFSGIFTGILVVEIFRYGHDKLKNNGSKI